MKYKAQATLLPFALILGARLAFAAQYAMDYRPWENRGDGQRLQASVALPEPDEDVLRQVFIPLAEAPVLAAELAVGDEVAVSLFDDAETVLTILEEAPSASGGKSFLASSTGHDGIANAVVVQSGDGLQVDVQEYDRRIVYSVFSSQSGVLVKELRQTEKPIVPGASRRVPVEPSENSPEVPAPRSDLSVSAAAQSTRTLVDVLVVFDQLASSWANSNGGGAANFAEVAVQKMNTALSNSGLKDDFRFRLVGVKEVEGQGALGYTDGTPLEMILDCIPGNGTLNGYRWGNLREYRDDANADIVCVLTDTGYSFGVVGIGYALTQSTAVYFANSAYNVCAIRAVAEGHTMTHEVGHNMGAGHSDRQASSPGPQYYSYSSGYYFHVGSSGYGTVMSYNSDGYGNTYALVPYFSTPNCTYNGVAVGDSSHDNARTLRNNFAMVAEFRGGAATEPIGGGAPAAPGSVSAADGSSTANVAVSWGSVSGAASYTLYRGTTSTPTSALKSGLTSTSYTDTSATPGKLYYYRVKAVNGAGSSGYSASDSGYRKLTAPTISAATGSASGVALSWGGVTGATYYRVYRATSSSGTKTALGSWQTGTTYTDTSGTAGTTYYYFVQAAVDSSGTRPSAYSAAKTGAKTKVSAPGTPGSVGAADGSSTANVTVSWGSVSGATSYTLYRGTTSAPTSALKSGLTSTSYTDTSATPGTLYYYRVKAVNGAGSSGYSASDSGYRKLTAPTISAATGSASGVALSWGGVTGATHYRVYRAATSSGAKTALGSWQTGTTYTDASGTAGTTYYYFVQAAVDSSGTRPSDYSAAKTGVRSRPANDNFASASTLSGYRGTVSGNNNGATKQSGEPAHAGVSTANTSVWWSWKAPATGQVVIDTEGSAEDTILAVYTGTAVGSLKAVASNDDAVGTASRVVFNTTAGTTYRIAVSSGYGAAGGDIVLSWSLAVPNAPNIVVGSGIVTVSGKEYFRVKFKGKSGKTYRVQRKTNLADASWSTVKTVTPSSDGLQTADIALVSSARSAFYRVVLEE